ncbi:MAG: GAF domain-containing protein [Anaerolineae bacterium]|nr:GAF domain-containing protein [Anaerolineae bacterium]
MEWLYRLARALHYQGLDANNVLYTALSMTCSALDVTKGGILTFDDGGELRDVLLPGAEAASEQRLWHMLLAEGFLGFVQHGQHTIYVRDTRADARWAHLPESWQGSAIGIPLMHHSNLLGALIMLHPQIDYFRDDVSEFLDEAGGLIAAAYENALSAQRLEAQAEHAQEYYEQLQQKKSEQSEIEQLRRDLASMTYHDLRGLLQNIYTGLSGMEAYVKDRAIAVSLLRLAMQSTRQMTRMVKGLLDIDVLEQGSRVITKRRTPLRPLLDEVMELVRPAASEADQTVSLEMSEILPDVQIDADMITRVLVNLIENAVKHTPANGHVTLSVRVRHDAVAFSVSDTGPGIPVSHMQEIFDKFYRIRHTNAPTGVGLGLAFCRLAVEAHGGRIWVENQPDSGAVFTFTLPLELVATPA